MLQPGATDSRLLPDHALYLRPRGPLAQLGERRLCTAEASGSRPVRSTSNLQGNRCWKGRRETPESRSSRMIGPASVLAWVMLVGLAANLAAIAVGPRPGPLGGSDLGWMFLAGASNVVGLLLVYSALRRGKVGLVAPIVSTEGSIAAVLALAAGEALGIASALLLAVIAVGVVLAALAPEELPVAGERKSLSVGLATAAALLFGVSLYATGRLGDSLPTAWALLPPRVVGLAAVSYT